MRELAFELACDASNLTRITDRLEAKGYLNRQVDRRDRRVKNLVLTDIGIAVADEIWIAVATQSSLIGLPESTKASIRRALHQAEMSRVTPNYLGA